MKEQIQQLIEQHKIHTSKCNEEIDYKILLEKYINHVDICDGHHYLSDHNRSNTKDKIPFSKTEWEELKNLYFKD